MSPRMEKIAGLALCLVIGVGLALVLAYGGRP